MGIKIDSLNVASQELLNKIYGALLKKQIEFIFVSISSVQELVILTTANINIKKEVKK